MVGDGNVLLALVILSSYQVMLDLEKLVYNIPSAAFTTFQPLFEQTVTFSTNEWFWIFVSLAKVHNTTYCVTMNDKFAEYAASIWK